MRNDNLTNFAYVGPNDGQQQPPEVFYAFRPADPADPTPIQPGETAQLKNAQTGKYCRIAALTSGYPLSKPISVLSKKAKLPPRGVAAASFRAKISPSGRHLLQVPSSCATQGVLCDQDTIATSSTLTYTGLGMSYNGVPLVQSPNSRVLLLSSDPSCTTPGGNLLTFPPAALCKQAAVTSYAVASRVSCNQPMLAVEALM